MSVFFMLIRMVLFWFEKKFRFVNITVIYRLIVLLPTQISTALAKSHCHISALFVCSRTISKRLNNEGT